MTACPAIQPALQQAPASASTRFDPPPTDWKQLLLNHAKQRQNSRDTTTAITREQLGLPTHQPIVLTGHQPGFHHAGIDTKAFAAAQLAEQTGAQPVWIVVDHDHTNPLSLRLHTGNTTIPTNTPINPALTPSQLRPVICPINKAHQSTGNDTPNPTTTAAHFLNKHATAPSLAIQSARAYLDHLGLLQNFIIIPATALANTDRFQQLTADLALNTLNIINAYNAAAAAHPTAKVRQLTQSKPAWHAELPLWFLPENQPRQPVTLDDAQHWFNHNTRLPSDLFQSIRHQLAPRAIFMTLLCRLDVADLFIHGQGGHTYEHVTDHWHQHWHPSLATLAPVTLATADAYPAKAGNTDQLTPQQARQQLNQATWLARSAAHNPHLLKDNAANETKQAILDQIEHSKQTLGRGHPQTAALHRSLKHHLQTYRTANADQLAKLNHQAAEAAGQLDRAAALTDRTISTLALSSDILIQLEHAVRSAFNQPAP